MTYRLDFENPNLPMHDHTGDGYLFQVIESDCDNAVPDDPTGCALALAGKRSMRKLVSIHVLTTVAYLEFRDHIERVRCASPTSGMIREFDRTTKFVQGNYLFGAVPPSDTYEAKKIRNGRAHKGGSRPNAGRRQERTAIIRPRGSKRKEQAAA